MAPRGFGGGRGGSIGRGSIGRKGGAGRPRTRPLKKDGESTQTTGRIATEKRATALKSGLPNTVIKVGKETLKDISEEAKEETLKDISEGTKEENLKKLYEEREENLKKLYEEREEDLKKLYEEREEDLKKLFEERKKYPIKMPTIKFRPEFRPKKGGENLKGTLKKREESSPKKSRKKVTSKRLKDSI